VPLDVSIAALGVAKFRRTDAKGSSDAVQPISGSIQGGDAGSNSSSHFLLVCRPLCITDAAGWHVPQRGAPKGAHSDEVGRGFRAKAATHSN